MVGFKGHHNRFEPGNSMTPSNETQKNECVVVFLVQNFGFHLGWIMHGKSDVIYESGQIYDVIYHFLFNGIDPNNNP